MQYLHVYLHRVYELKSRFDKVSNEELAAVLKSAEEWRGEQGERRKTAIYDYIWEQEKVGLDRKINI